MSTPHTHAGVTRVRLRLLAAAVALTAGTASLVVVILLVKSVLA
jgi:hypothetical protein